MSRPKINYLKKRGYKYYFQRMVWVNKQRRKIFSYEAVEAHNALWVKNRVKEKTNTPFHNWTFYFLDQPSDYCKQEILIDLGF